MLTTVLIIALLAQVVSPPPMIDDRNDTASAKNRITEQSVTCRRNDRVAVRIVDGRVVSVVVSGKNIVEQIANAIDVPVDHVAFECRDKTFFLTPYDNDGNSLGVLSLRYN